MPHGVRDGVELAVGIVNLMEFTSFVPVSGRRGLRTFNSLGASMMHFNCSNLFKLTVPTGPRAVLNALATVRLALRREKVV
jgi:hypothetical protein